MLYGSVRCSFSQPQRLREMYLAGVTEPCVCVMVFLTLLPEHVSQASECAVIVTCRVWLVGKENLG